MHSTILNPGDLVIPANPFQSRMVAGRGAELDGPLLEAPLPMSRAKDQPTVLDSISGFFSLSLPSLHVLAMEGEATRLALERRAWLALLVVIDGEVGIRQDENSLVCSAGDCLFLPEPSVHWMSSAYNVICLLMSPDRLKEDLKAMAYQGFEKVSPCAWNFSQPILRQSSDGVLEASLIRTLLRLLRLTSELAEAQPILLGRLGISKQLCLLSALLASPDVCGSLASERVPPREGGVAEAIDELIVYMQNNLSEPLNLTVLERYSHYSRRALQYAFRQRFGCTITQWLRAHRLDLAYEHILQAEHGETVASIAKDCGYRSVSLFSLDFQKRFHVKPSTLLRHHQTQP